MTTEFAARKNEECYEPRLYPAPPRRGAPGLPPAAHRARLRPPEGARRAVRLGQRLGAAELLRPLDAPADFDHDAAVSGAAAGGNMRSMRRRPIREGVGLIDATAFTKHRVKGPGATAFLDWFTCNKLPKVGRINLTYALTPMARRAPNTPSCGWRGRLLPGLCGRAGPITTPITCAKRRGQERRSSAISRSRT